MRVAPSIPDEFARLLDLAHYNILDTSPEEAYTRIVRIVARLLDVPIAYINFVDQDRHWGKATIGIPGYDVPRADAPCAWTILQHDPLLIPDLQLDPRFQDLPAVEQGIRMYAGAPLHTPRGHAIGTLCVLDVQPRTLTSDDLHTLQDLAAVVVSELELRRHIQTVEREIDAQQQYLEGIKRELQYAHTLEAVTAFNDAQSTPEDISLQAAQLIAQSIGADWSGLITIQGQQAQVRQVHALPQAPQAILDLTEELNRAPQGITATAATLQQSLYIDDYPQHPHAFPRAVRAGVQAGAWIPLGSWEGKSAVLIIVRLARDAIRLPWRAADRALIEAAGRSVRFAIQRYETLAAATAASRQDSLTGIGNRRALEDDLAQHPLGTATTLVMMDLDGFKNLNDTAGHAEGDKALRIFASALRAEFGADRCYRLGGDEFVLRLAGCWEEDHLMDRLDPVVLALRHMLSVPLGVSVGSAHCEDDRLLETLRQADAQMYVAKRRRKASRLI